MPKFRITDSLTGVSTIVEAPEPPSEEEAIRILEEQVKPDLLGDVITSATSGIAGGVGGIASLADLVTGGLLSRAANRVLGTEGTIGGEFQQLASEAQETLSPGTQLRLAHYAETPGLIPKLAYAATQPELIASQLASSLTQMLPAAGLVGGLGGAAVAARPVLGAGLVEGTTQAGSALSEAEAQKGRPLQFSEAVLPLASGLTTGAIGALGGRTARALGVENIENLLLGSVTRPSVGSMARNIAVGGAIEGLVEETPQTITEAIYSAAEKNLLGGRPLLEDVTAETIFQDVPLAAVTGFAAGGLAQVPGELSRRLGSYDQENVERVQGGQQQGQEPWRTLSLPQAGGETTETGGVLQAPEEAEVKALPELELLALQAPAEEIPLELVTPEPLPPAPERAALPPPSPPSLPKPPAGALPPAPELPAIPGGLSRETFDFYEPLSTKPWVSPVFYQHFFDEIPVRGQRGTFLKRARAFFQQRSAPDPRFSRSLTVVAGYHDSSSATLPSIRVPLRARYPGKALENELARSISVTILSTKPLSNVEKMFIRDVGRVRQRLSKIAAALPTKEERRAAREILSSNVRFVGSLFTDPMFGRLFGQDLQARLIRAFREAVANRVLPERPMGLLTRATEASPVQDWFKKFMTERPLYNFIRGLVPGWENLVETKLRYRFFRQGVVIRDFDAFARALTEHFGESPISPQTVERLKTAGIGLTFEHSRTRPELHFASNGDNIVVNLGKIGSEAELFRILRRLNDLAVERRFLDIGAPPIRSFLEDLRGSPGDNEALQKFLEDISRIPSSLSLQDFNRLLKKYLPPNSPTIRVMYELADRIEKLIDRAKAAGITRIMRVFVINRPELDSEGDALSLPIPGEPEIRSSVTINLGAIWRTAGTPERFFKRLAEVVAHEYAHIHTDLAISQGMSDFENQRDTPHATFYKDLRKVFSVAYYFWSTRKSDIILEFGLDDLDEITFEYAFTNSHEFVATFFQSEKFRAWLDSVEYTKKQTFYQKILWAIAKLLGIKNPYSAAAALLDLLTDNVDTLGMQYEPMVVYNQIRRPATLFGDWMPIDVPQVKFAPDFGPFKVHKKVFFAQQLWSGTYWLQRLLGGPAIFRRIAFQLPGDRTRNIDGMSAIVAWFVEKYGIANAYVNRFTYMLPRDIDDVFAVDPRTGDVMGVRPLKAGLSLKLGDILEEEDPFALYAFTPKQEEYLRKFVLPVLKEKDDLLRKYQIDKVLDENGDPLYRLARVVVQRPDARKTGRHTSATPRVYLTEADGWAAGVVYSTSLRERLRETLRYTYRTVADKRVVNDLKTSIAWVPEKKLKELRQAYPRASEDELQKMVEALKVKGKVRHHIFEGIFFDEEVAELLNREIGYMPSKLRDGIARVNAALKASETGFDVGVGMIQLGVLFRHRPTVWAKAMYRSVLEMLRPGTAAEFFRQHDKAVMELAEYGSPIGELPDIAEGLRRGELLVRVPVVGPLAYRFGLQLRTALDISKVLLWEIHSKNRNLSLFDTMEIIRTIEAEIGTARFESDGIHRNRVLLERVLFYSTAYYRAQIHLVATAIASKSEEARIEAIKALGAFAFVQALLFVAFGLAIGMDEEELLRRLHPSHPKFMLWEFDVGDGRKVVFGTGGFYLAAFRMLGTIWRLFANGQGYKLASLKAEDNPLIRFYIGHASPLISRTVAALTGRTYLKERVDLSSMRTAQRLVPVPFWLQDESIPASAISFLGGSAYVQKREPYHEVVRRVTGAPSPNEATIEQLMRAGQALRFMPKRSPEEQELAVQGATDIAYRATMEIFDSLPKMQRNFLERHRLVLPLTPMQINRAGVTVPLNPDLEKKYRSYIAEEYKNAITRLMASPNLGAWLRAGSLQQRLDHYLEVARQRARTRLLSEALHNERAESSTASSAR